VNPLTQWRDVKSHFAKGAGWPECGIASQVVFFLPLYSVGLKGTESWQPISARRAGVGKKMLKELFGRRIT